MFCYIGTINFTLLRVFFAPAVVLFSHVLHSHSRKVISAFLAVEMFNQIS